MFQGYHHAIIDRCREAMYNAIWLEIDRDPQEPAPARVDIKTGSGEINVYCDRMGNVACVTHNGSCNDSELLETAIEGCVDYDTVMDDWLEANPDGVSHEDELASRWDTWRLDALMVEMYY